MAEISSESQLKREMLSRAAVYAPLAAYYQDKVAPAEYLQRKKSIPEELSEGSLLSFLETVSVNFHRQKRYLDGKNTSGRPLSKKEISDKMLQRGLTLVGGGFQTPLAKARRADKVKPSRHRRKMRIRTSVLTLDGVCLPSQLNFLEKLNRMWNDYVWNMLDLGNLTLGTPVANCCVRRTLQEKLHRLSSTMEWVGAKIRIEKCNANPKWIRRIGIIICNTPRTWRVFWLDSNLKDKADNYTKSTPATEEDVYRQKPLMIVAHTDSIIRVFIPLGREQDSLFTDPGTLSHLAIDLQQA